MVEFALVGAVVVVLVAGVLQLGLALHVRNTLQAAASDGARHGAAAGRGPAEAVDRTRSVITGSLGRGFARDVRAVRERVDGVPTVAVDVRARLPVLGPWGPSGALHVRAHSFAELR